MVGAGIVRERVNMLDIATASLLEEMLAVKEQLADVSEKVTALETSPVDNELLELNDKHQGMHWHRWTYYVTPEGEVFHVCPNGLPIKTNGTPSLEDLVTEGAREVSMDIVKKLGWPTS